MKLSKTTIILSVLAISLVLLQYLRTDTQKIAYVFVEDVITEYHAMQDVNDQLKLKESEQKEELDKFYIEVQEKVSWLQENHKKLKEASIVEKQHEIIDLEKIFNQKQERAYKQMDSVKISWTKPYYEEINQYIKDYSQDKGYDYVLGNLGNGNVMYGSHIHDITLEIIDGINVAYNKQKMEQ